jgi:antitoxin (DNA-binding transcriptional repressor) of toxin-antitoxin stability system
LSRKKHLLRLTATHAARDFSRLLDLVEEGAEAVIERRQQAVAVIRPAKTMPRRTSECLAVRLARRSVRPDPGFARDLQAIIEGRRNLPDQELDARPLGREPRPRSAIKQNKSGSSVSVVQ